MKLGTKIKIRGKDYVVTGVDHYSLTDLFGGKKDWDSNTLKSDDETCWITEGIDKKVLLWNEAKKKNRCELTRSSQGLVWHCTDFVSGRPRILNAHVNGLAF